MKVYTQSVNFSADQKLLDFIQKKVSSLVKFHDKIIDAELFLKVQKTSDKENKVTEIKVNIPGNEIMVKRESRTFEEGVNLALDSLKRQLKRIKQKQRAIEVS